MIKIISLLKNEYDCGLLLSIIDNDTSLGAEARRDIKAEDGRSADCDVPDGEMTQRRKDKEEAKRLHR